MGVDDFQIWKDPGRPSDLKAEPVSRPLISPTVPVRGTDERSEQKGLHVRCPSSPSPSKARLYSPSFLLVGHAVPHSFMGRRIHRRRSHPNSRRVVLPRLSLPIPFLPTHQQPTRTRCPRPPLRMVPHQSMHRRHRHSRFTQSVSSLPSCRNAHSHQTNWHPRVP